MGRSIPNSPMIDPITRMRFLPDLALEAWYPIGVLDRLMASLNTTYFGFEERIGRKPFNRYADLSAIVRIDLNYQDVELFAGDRSTSSEDLPPVKSAIFAPDDRSFEFSTLYAGLMESSPIEVRVFRTVEDAARWLGVPASALRE